jgi:hypothetical protein
LLVLVSRRWRPPSGCCGHSSSARDRRAAHDGRVTSDLCGGCSDWHRCSMVLVPSVNARAGDPPVTFQPGHTYWASLVEGRGSTGVVDDVTAGGTTFATLAISRSDFGQFAWSLDLKTLYLAERGVGSVVAPLTVEAARVPASRAAARWSTPHPPTSAAVSARCSASPSWCGDGAGRRDRAGIRAGGSPGEAPDRCGAHLWVSEAVPRASNTTSQGCEATSQACESFFWAANQTSQA